MKALAAWLDCVKWNWREGRGTPYAIAMFPERLWRWILGRLWHDRLALQYERGYEDGLREGLFNAEYYVRLYPWELAELIGCTEQQADLLLSSIRPNAFRSEQRARVLEEINQQRGLA